MKKCYSIAKADHNLAAIVEQEKVIAPKRNFWDAYVAFRDSIDLEQLNIEANTFEDVRDHSPGRE